MLTRPECLNKALAYVRSLTHSAPFGQHLGRLALLVLFSGVSFGQCVVTTDQAGHLVTICTGYAPKDGFLMNRPDQSQSQATTVYGGSPYLSFPIYEAGVLEFTATDRKIPCQLAFNLATNQVICRFNKDSLEYAIIPDAFTVGGRRFVRKSSSRGEQIYYMVLYTGKSRLLAQLKSTLQLTKREPYVLDDLLDGTYIRQERYFIERENKSLQEVVLSKKSVQKALAIPPNQLPVTPTKDKLTVQEMIGLVATYDGFQ